MNGTIVAVNRNLGVVVVQTDEQNCVVLEASGLLSFTIGDEVHGDWDQPGEIVVQNQTSGDQLHARVQKTNITRSEAVGAMSFI